MIRYLLLRLATLAATLLAASALVFGALELLPGNAAQVILGETATPEQAQEAHRFIRQWLRQPSEASPVPPSETTAILYGGSVTPENFAGLLAGPDVDGGLVGGASLDPEEFARIVQYRLHDDPAPA